MTVFFLHFGLLFTVTTTLVTSGDEAEFHNYTDFKTGVSWDRYWIDFTNIKIIRACENGHIVEYHQRDKVLTNIIMETDMACLNCLMQGVNSSCPEKGSIIVKKYLNYDEAWSFDMVEECDNIIEESNVTTPAAYKNFTASGTLTFDVVGKFSSKGPINIALVGMTFVLRPGSWDKEFAQEWPVTLIPRPQSVREPSPSQDTITWARCKTQRTFNYSVNFEIEDDNSLSLSIFKKMLSEGKWELHSPSQRVGVTVVDDKLIIFNVPLKVKHISYDDTSDYAVEQANGYHNYSDFKTRHWEDIYWTDFTDGINIVRACEHNHIVNYYDSSKEEANIYIADDVICLNCLMQGNNYSCSVEDPIPINKFLGYREFTMGTHEECFVVHKAFFKNKISLQQEWRPTAPCRSAAPTETLTFNTRATFSSKIPVEMELFGGKYTMKPGLWDKQTVRGHEFKTLEQKTKTIQVSPSSRIDATWSICRVDRVFEYFIDLEIEDSGIEQNRSRFETIKNLLVSKKLELHSPKEAIGLDIVGGKLSLINFPLTLNYSSYVYSVDYTFENESDFQNFTDFKARRPDDVFWIEFTDSCIVRSCEYGRLVIYNATHKIITDANVRDDVTCINCLVQAPNSSCPEDASIPIRNYSSRKFIESVFKDEYTNITDVSNFSNRDSLPRKWRTIPAYRNITAAETILTFKVGGKISSRVVVGVPLVNDTDVIELSGLWGGKITRVRPIASYLSPQPTPPEKGWRMDTQTIDVPPYSWVNATWTLRRQGFSFSYLVSLVVDDCSPEPDSMRFKTFRDMQAGGNVELHCPKDGVRLDLVDDELVLSNVPVTIWRPDYGYSLTYTTQSLRE